MIAEFVFVVIVDSQPHYVGTFKSCMHADLYKSLYISDTIESRCLHSSNIVLPDNFKHRYIDIHDACKLKRNCNE